MLNHVIHLRSRINEWRNMYVYIYMYICFSTYWKMISKSKTKKGRGSSWEQMPVLGFTNGTLFQVTHDINVEMLFYP